VTNHRELVRDPARVKSALAETPDGKLIAIEPVKIYIPARLEERGLAEVGIETFIYGVYAITLEDSYYRVSLVSAMNHIEPRSVMKVPVDEDEYYELSFDIGYNEMACLLDSAKYHAGVNVGQNHDITELLVSVIARNASERHEFYRTSVKSQHDLLTHPPVFVPLRSIEFAATSTLAKMGGSYFSHGVVSALVSPGTRVERLNDILAR
jgi:hypothetical protein